jgi:hypothetical protein
MGQTIFSPDVNAFCRKHLVESPGVPAPSERETLSDMDVLQRNLFENLLLFDKLALKIEGECIAVPLLIRVLGQKGFDAHRGYSGEHP